MIVRSIEAILFVNGDPVSFAKLAEHIGCSVEEIAAACDALQHGLQERNAGIALNIHGNSAQLVTAPDQASVIESFLKKGEDEPLTPAVLETLSLIAYLGPVTRAEVEYVRGVNSTFTLRALLLRGLIERVPDARGAQGQNLYRVTHSLLQYLGIQRLEDLPAYAEHADLLKEYRSRDAAQPPSEAA